MNGLFLTRRFSSNSQLPFVTAGVELVLVILACALAAIPHAAQAAELCQSAYAADLPKVLNFEMPGTGGLKGWLRFPAETIFLDKTAIHDNHLSVRIERKSLGPSSSSGLTSCVLMNFSGKNIELRGFLRTENVNGSASLWIREDGYSGTLALLNTSYMHVHGDTGWTEYSVSIPDEPQSRRLVFGALLEGTGKVWVSGLQLLVDGKPIWKAPKHAFTKTTVLDTDRQFDKSSGITIQHLSKVQIANLVTLGKVWGFLKYYDPSVTAGHWQWDYELFRVLPEVLAAPSQTSANAVLLHWIKGLGPVTSCHSCAHLEQKNLQLQPALGWIHDTQLLGEALSKELGQIYKNRRIGPQFYVALDPEDGNAIFGDEWPYRTIHFPDSGFQLLALYRYWNIIEYWYPYRNVVGENWGRVLAEFIPKLAMAKNRTDYARDLMELIALIHDTHAELWSSLNMRPPVGSCHLPIRLRFVQNQAVVTGYQDGTSASSSPFQIGDAMTEFDGSPVSRLVKEWSPYYGASNKAALQRNIARFMSRGACGEATVGIRRDARVMNLKVQRVPIGPTDLSYGIEDVSGPTFQLFSPQVAYLKLSPVDASRVADYIKRAMGTKGLIIDVRDYISEPVALRLGSHLVTHVTPFARQTVGELSNPGAFHWTPPISITPQTSHYTGKIVILVGADTQSASEYTSIALRAAPNAIVVGSTTAGADGKVSSISLPGGFYTTISGTGVFYPDKRPTQRIGIVPNVVVQPTIEDVRAGRDVVLEKALHLILGPQPLPSEYERYLKIDPDRP